MIMYYVEVVPTDIETFASHVKTYQYSVKENIRAISKFIYRLCWAFKTEQSFQITIAVRTACREST